MPLSRLICVALLVSSQFVFGAARADWTGPAQAAAAMTLMEIRVEEGKLEIELEIDGRDRSRFRDLLDRGRYEAAFGVEDIDGEVVRRARFFAETGIGVRVDGGERSAGRVVRLEDRARRPRELPQGGGGALRPERSQRVLYAQLEFTLSGAPDVLEILPPPVDARDRGSLNIGFITRHLGMPLHDYRYLEGPELLRLDWRDGWRSRYDSLDLRRDHESPLLDYVYIGDFEVRHEILIRVRDLSPWFTPALASSDEIAPDERAAVAEEVAELLLSRSSLFIDGEEVHLTLDSVEYLEFGFGGVAVAEVGVPLPTARAWVGVVLSRPLRGVLPASVEMEWELFNETFPEVSALVIGPSRSSLSHLTELRPRLEWRNVLDEPRAPTVEAVEVVPVQRVVRLPVLAALAALFSIALMVSVWRRREARWDAFVVASIASLILVIAGAAIGGTREIRLPIEEEISTTPGPVRFTLSPILQNIHRSFDAREEAAVHARLALSVEPGVERSLILEHHRAFSVEAHGGALATVDRVELVAVENSRVVDGSLRARATWVASGTLKRWGQSHRRTCRFIAEVEVSPVDGVWKLSGFELRELERLQ